VPKTKTTLYHPLSKAPLQPGTQIDRYVADERWLIHKHRDTLGDYIDLEPAEIEFMQVWDSYFLPLHLSSELFLPPHYLAFTKEKADWIVEKRERAAEFGKHMAVMQIRGVIRDEHVVKLAAIIQEANERREEREKMGNGAEKQPEPQPEQPPKKTVNGCAKCGKFVERGPAWLKCVREVSFDLVLLTFLFLNNSANDGL
jgi:ribosomal protein L44E